MDDWRSIGCIIIIRGYAGGISPEHHVERGFGAQDGASDDLGDLRQNRVTEGFDDQTGRSRPAWTADRNARASHPGGNPIIHP